MNIKQENDAIIMQLSHIISKQYCECEVSNKKEADLSDSERLPYNYESITKEKREIR